MTLYLTEQGTKLRKTSRRIIVEKEGITLLEVPLFQLDRVLVFGAVQLSTQAISMLLENGIDVSFLTITGRLRGRLVCAESKNVFLRLAQYDRSRDEDFKLRFAKQIIRAKAKSQKALLLRFQRNHPEAEFSKEASTIEQALNDLAHKKTVASVMGLEGASTGAYFRSFARMLVCKEFRFEGRTRHPPLDPVNALLSLGYVILTNEIASLVESAGLDPHIGFLHGFRYGRQSLPLDLVEEFRHPVVDTLTLSLLNRRVFAPSDFEQQENLAYYLTREGFKRYLKYYEEQIGTPRGEKSESFRALLRRQIDRCEKAVLQNDLYEPFVMAS